MLAQGGADVAVGDVVPSDEVVQRADVVDADMIVAEAQGVVDGSADKQGEEQGSDDGARASGKDERGREDCHERQHGNHETELHEVTADPDDVGQPNKDGDDGEPQQAEAAACSRPAGEQRQQQKRPEPVGREE